MIELVVSKNVLSQILYEDKTFKHALNNQCFSKKEFLNIRKDVAGLVGCELRHHFLLKKVLDKLHLELTLDERTYLYLALANKHFYHKLDDAKVGGYLKEVFNEKYQQIAVLFSLEKSLYDYLGLDERTFDFLSIKFNLPKWLLKSFTKEIGLSKTYRIIHSLSRPINPTYRLNPYDKNAEEILKRYQDVLNNVIYPDVISISKKELLGRKELKGECLFKIDYHIKELIDENQNELINEVSVYSGEDDSLPLELMARGKHKLGVNVVCPSFDERSKLVRSIRLQKAKNINVFKANDVTSMLTGISRKQELFYCYPKSSSYSYINAYPDYIVRFRNTQIDSFVKEQQIALENCSQLVCDDGELIYMVNTLNHRETSDIVSSFLKKHPEYKLVKEKQILPENGSASFLYYAVLKLEAHTNGD